MMVSLELDLDACMDAYAQWVIQLAFRYLGNKQDAQDLAQDVFVKLYQYRRKVQLNRDIRPLLKTITVNCCLKQLKKVNVSVSLDELHDIKTEVHTDLKIDMQKALKTLTPHERMAIILTINEGHSTIDAGQLMGCRSGTIKSLCFRARKKMRRYFSAKEKEHEA